MIDYDPSRWTSHLLDIKGSMVREIIGRVAACTAVSAGVVALHKYGRVDLALPPTTHTLVGVALGLLLVFRTNASYDRYWEGRRQWGTITNETRNLARGTRAFVAPGAPDLARHVALWTTAFAHAAMNSLRNTDGLGPARDRLPPDEVRGVLESTHVPLAVSARISEHLAEARDRHVISDYVMGQLDANVQTLIDALGACERIRKTPLPFVYVVHLRRALFLYCYTLPFALVDHYGWWTVLDVFLVAYTFFGIEEIGVEIENPFGHDANDLPLERFCETIGRDVLGVMDLPPLAPELPAPAAVPVVQSAPDVLVSSGLRP